MIFKGIELDRLDSPHIHVDEPFNSDPKQVSDHPRLNDLRDIFVVGNIYYDRHSSKFICDLEIDGVMEVPCAITLRPVELDFNIQLEDMFSFDELEAGDEGIKVDGDTLDLSPYIMGSILSEVPLSITDPDIDEYPHGEGWQVMTEEDYIKEKNQEIDPRLAKLKDFKFE